MLTITYKDLSKKTFSLKNENREKTFFEMWTWCSKHVPEKKLKVTTNDDEFVVALGDIINIIKSVKG